jgi:hypothetical protein
MESGHQDPSAGPKKQNPYNSYLKYSGLALQLLVTLAVFGWLGYKVDGWLQLTYPVFLILFLFAAFAGMMYNLYKSIGKE